MSFGLRSLLPVSLVLVGCGFFTLDEPEKQPAKMMTGGTGGATGGTGGATGGTGGATGGTGGAMAGTGGAMAGTGGAIATGGAGGVAGDTSTGGSAGATAGSAGDTSTGGTAGTGGDAAGGAGSGGTAGEGAGAGGTAGGSGGSGPTTCAAINAQAQAYGGHCYYRNSTAVSWSAAKAGCEALAAGGHLVTITSMAEQQFVWGVAGMMDAWIGATDGLMDNQGGNGMPSTWITGEDIAQFNGWASGEPNNYQKECPGGGGMCWEHCGFMWVDTQGAWNDDVCGYDKAYICEWDTGG
jgi:hypothetical protein